MTTTFTRVSRSTIRTIFDNYCLDIEKVEGEYEVTFKETVSCHWVPFYCRPVVRDFRLLRDAKSFSVLFKAYAMSGFQGRSPEQTFLR